MEGLLAILRDFAPLLAFGFFLGLFASMAGHKLGLWRKEFWEMGICAWILAGGGAFFLTIHRMVGSAPKGGGTNGLLILFMLFLAGGAAVAACTPLAILVALGFTKRLAERAGGIALMVSAAAAGLGFGAVERELARDRHTYQEAIKAAEPIASPVPVAVATPSVVTTPAPNLNKAELVKGFLLPAVLPTGYQLDTEGAYGPRGYQLHYSKILPHPGGSVSAVGINLQYTQAQAGKTRCDVDLDPAMQIPEAERFEWRGGRGTIFNVNASAPDMAKLQLDYASSAGCLTMVAEFLKPDYSRAEMRKFLESFQPVL